MDIMSKSQYFTHYIFVTFTVTARVFYSILISDLKQFTFAPFPVKKFNLKDREVDDKSHRCIFKNLILSQERDMCTNSCSGHCWAKMKHNIIKPLTHSYYVLSTMSNEVLSNFKNTSIKHRQRKDPCSPIYLRWST